MFTGTLTHAAFSRTLYMYLDCQDDVLNAQNDSPERSFVRKLLQNALTASYLGTFHIIEAYSNLTIKVQFPLLHTASFYTAPAVGAAFISIPILSKVIEENSANEKIVAYTTLTQKFINTIAKIVNLAFTIFYVYSAFGEMQALITGTSLTYLTFISITNDLIPFDFDLKMS